MTLLRLLCEGCAAEPGAGRRGRRPDGRRVARRPAGLVRGDRPRVSVAPGRLLCAGLAMNWRDFLSLAARLAADVTEADWRAAVSRAYYAAFHVARQLLT